MYPYLTDETITYNINGNDLIFEQSVNDPNSTIPNENILLSEDYAIHMGSHLDPSVKEYYCEVIQYVYNSYNDQSSDVSHTDVNFTQLYSSIPTTGKAPKHLLYDKARLPLTQPTSTKNNTHVDDNYNGMTRNNIGILQRHSFICENFNQKIHHFRMASIRPSGCKWYNASTEAQLNSYGDAFMITAYSVNIGGGGNMWVNRDKLKNFPHTIMYMTPIHKCGKVPQPLQYDKSFTLQISSRERISGSGENGFGVDCVVPIPALNVADTQRFKAVFVNLDIQGTMAISEYERTLCNFPFHFICYDWDKSAYGYGGDKNGGGFILTTNPITYNYQEQPDTASKLPSTQGSIIEIDNKYKEVRFRFLQSQMVPPSTDDLGHATTAIGFLSPFTPVWEWNLTMRIFPI